MTADRGCGLMRSMENEALLVEQPNRTERTDVPRTTDYTPRSVFERYLNDMCRFQLLAPDQETELVQRCRAGDDMAREQLILGNLRLVIKIAREYQDFGVPLTDLINEGNIGLMEAVERFNTDRGCKLSTYASFWIKQRMRKALVNSPTVRVPTNSVWELRRLNRMQSQLQSDLERDPTVAELSAATGLSEARIGRLEKSRVRTISLDTPLDGEGGETLAELFADDRAESPSGALETHSTKQNISAALKECLSKRESAILQGRFGLDGGRSRNLEEIAETFGISPERVRQIQNRALRKLKGWLVRTGAVSAEMPIEN